MSILTNLPLVAIGLIRARQNDKSDHRSACLSIFVILMLCFPAQAFGQQRSSKDQGYFYRLRAEFEVKATAEKVNFDYVVACNIRLTRWRDGGLSDDSTYSPRVMFAATSNGPVVMLRTLQACHGLTSEYPDVPADVLPLAVWFDSPEDLSVGVGYVSEDAYDNSLGKLRFHGARVDRATREEWEAWRKAAADTYVQIGTIPGPWGYDFPVPRGPFASDRGKYVTGCQGYMKLKLPDDMRPRLAALQPADRSRFWVLATSEERLKIGAVIDDPRQPYPPGIGGWVRRFGTPANSASSGLPIRSGRVVEPSLRPNGSRSKHVANRWPAENYASLATPLISISPVRVAAFPPAKTYERKLEYRDGALNGLISCQNLLDAYGYRMRESDTSWRDKSHVFKVDEYVVKQLNNRTPELDVPAYVVEGDEAVFLAYNIIF